MTKVHSVYTELPDNISFVSQHPLCYDWKVGEWRKSKAPVSQLMNAEVNSGNRKAVLASSYAIRICGRHAALRECIMYKQLHYTRTLVPSNTRSNGNVDVCVLLVVLRGYQSTKKVN